jgi:hypothetical protein
MNSLERVGYVKIIEKHYVQEHFRVLKNHLNLCRLLALMTAQSLALMTAHSLALMTAHSLE